MTGPVLNLTTNSTTVDYNGGGAQSVNALNYYNLTISGARTTNNVTLASSGTIGVAASFSNTATFTSGGYVVTGSTVDYNGGSQNATGLFTYNNLTFSNSGNKSATIRGYHRKRYVHHRQRGGLYGQLL